MHFSLRFLFPFTLWAGLLAATPAFANGSSQKQVAEGAQLFSSSGCAHCHGDTLQGTEIAPSLRGVGKQLKPDEIRKQIHDGGKVMPAFGDVFTGDQIDQLVAFLRTQRAKVPRAQKPPSGL